MIASVSSRSDGTVAPRAGSRVVVKEGPGPIVEGACKFQQERGALNTGTSLAESLELNLPHLEETVPLGDKVVESA